MMKMTEPPLICTLDGRSWEVMPKVKMVAICCSQYVKEIISTSS